MCNVAISDQPLLPPNTLPGTHLIWVVLEIQVNIKENILNSALTQS